MSGNASSFDTILEADDEDTSDRVLGTQIPAVYNVGGQPMQTGPMSSAVPVLYGLTSPVVNDGDRDAEMARDIEAALAEEPRLSSTALEHIQFDVAYGVVELSGFVPTDADRRIAEEAISRLPGVSAVENRLEVLSEM